MANFFQPDILKVIHVEGSKWENPKVFEPHNEEDAKNLIKALNNYYGDNSTI